MYLLRQYSKNRLHLYKADEDCTWSIDYIISSSEYRINVLGVEIYKKQGMCNLMYELRIIKIKLIFI